MPNVTESSRAQSPLAVDMALTRVGLAALKAKRHEAANEGERESALLLAIHYQMKLRCASTHNQISPEIVPRRKVREVLQGMLSASNGAQSQSSSRQRKKLEELIRLLRSMASAERLNDSDANLLRKRLSEVADRKTPQSELPEPPVFVRA